MTRHTGGADGSQDAALRYQLPRPDGGVWLGLRLSAVLVLILGVAGAVLLVLAGAPVAAAAGLLVLVGVLALVPVAELPALHWLSPLSRHLLRAARRDWTAASAVGVDPDDGATAVSRTGRRNGRPDAEPRQLSWRLTLPPECGQLVATCLHDGAAAGCTASCAPAAAAGTCNQVIAGAAVDAARGGVVVLTPAPRAWHGNPLARPASRRGGAGQDGSAGPGWAPGTHTLVLEVRGPSGFALLDESRQDTHLAGWGGALDALAADPRVLRVQWLTHTRPDTTLDRAADARSGEPDTGSALRCRATAGELVADDGRTTDMAHDGARELSGRELARDYDELVGQATGQAWQHTHLLAVTVRATAPLRRAIPAGSLSSATTRAALLEQVRALAGLLLGADVLARPLDLAEFAWTLRLLTEPDLPLGRPRSGAAGSGSSGRASWGLRCRRGGWDAVRTGDAWHRSYAVTGWPSLALRADWLAGLLAVTPPAGTSRTLSVHATPVAAVHAIRRARAAAAKVHLDAADRSRFGLAGPPGGASPVEAQRASDAAALQEELAAGYRMLQTRALVTVSAVDPGRLEQATTALRTVCGTHRLDVRPLHGQHQQGLAATLPLTVISGARP